MENAAINFMIKTFKNEKIEKEAVGLLGGANFERGKPFRLRQDLDHELKKEIRIVKRLNKWKLI